ncbi:MAG: hypothetical protein DRP42_04670 [Tenericutes bacterium]|nr:MAG: hypothetical protein DRP42_04670 [Mycoplasmatota bacterium]
MANVRNWLYKNRQKRLNTNTRHTAGKDSINAENESKIRGEGESVETGEGYSIVKTHGSEISQEGPDRQIISKMPTKFQRRLRKVGEYNDYVHAMTIKLAKNIWKQRPWRKKTAIELDYIAEKNKLKKDQMRLRREGREFARRASTAYARMGICYVPPAGQRSLLNGIKKVQFSNIVAEKNAIWLQIDTDRLPYGVDILTLIHDEGVLTNLSASLRHHVQGRYDVERGAWLCVERGRGVRGIPQYVDFAKMIELIPEDAHRLTVPFGETINSRRMYRSLRDFPHLLIAGSTGQGKTSFLNVILATLINNNSIHDLKLVLVDLKNGIEFDMYRGIPHLWKMGDIAPEGIVGRPEKVIDLLGELVKEGERRLHLFRRMGITNIDEYNKGRSGSRRMPRIVVMIDEWARVALSPQGKQADNILSEITATYRAVGYHVILATQTPITRVISTLIKTNFNAKLAFGVPTNVSSMVILDTGRAKGLEPVGRAVFQYGTQVIESQVPYITKKELIAVLDKARSDGGFIEDTVSTQEILKYSLESLGGSLSIRRIHEHFGTRIGRNQVANKLKDIENEQNYEIDGKYYYVKTPPIGGGQEPRQLLEYQPEKTQEGGTQRA